MRTNLKNRLIWCADFETSKEAEVVLAAAKGVVLDYNHENYKIEENMVYSEDVGAFLEKIYQESLNIIRREGMQTNLVQVYFHNMAKFDGSYLLHYLKTKSFLKDITSNPKMNNIDTFSYLMSDDMQIYSFDINYKGLNIQVLDSFKLLSLSIKTLGEMQGKRKLDIDYALFNIAESMEEKLEYIKTDVEIMIKPLCDFILNFGKVKMTAGANALQSLKEELEANKENFKKYTSTTTELAMDFISWVRGGLTFYNRSKLHKVIDNALCYDANSFYPSIMTRPMINCQSIHQPSSKCNVGLFCMHDVTWYKILVYKATPKLGNNFHFLYVKGSYYNEIDTPEIVYYFKEEWEELLNWYEIDYEILDTWVAESFKWAKAWVEKIYALRKKYKQEKSAKEYTYKIILNSIFGKMCEKIDKHRIVYEPKGKITEDGEPHPINDLIYVKTKDEKFNIGDEVAWVVRDLELPENSRNPIVGAHITSQGRTELMRIVRMNANHVIYGDTDSIFTTKEIKHFEGDKGNLNEWKRECIKTNNKIYEKFNMFIYGRKRYICFIDKQDLLLKAKMCGASLKVIEQYIKDNDVLKNPVKMVNANIPEGKLVSDIKDGKRVLHGSTYRIRKTH